MSSSQNGDDSLSLFADASSHISEMLHKISDDYAHIPPSPGDGRIPGLQFADGHLGDTMAAEFGDAETEGQVGLPAVGSSGPSNELDEELTTRNSINGARETDAVGIEVSAIGNEEVSSENGRIADRGGGSEENDEIQSVDESTIKDSVYELQEDRSEVPTDSGAVIPERETVETAVNETFKQQSPSPTTLGGEMVYNASAGDGEGHSRQRILAFAAKRYANAVERNSQDYDALYNWALVLQESADNVGSDSSGPGKDQLLEEACKKYQEATNLCPTLHEAFYNCAIAISDRAKMRGRTKEAEDLWKQACKNYEKSVQLNWNSPQALNNWGLALQELSGIVSIRDKILFVKTAIKKFRAAIQLQFDFHRAIYNLGTVLYGLAEDTFRSGRQVATKELTPTELYSQSAIYIAAAHALKPEYPVYKSALRLVRSMLPLAYLKTGYLSVSPDGNLLTPHKDWKRLWFVLDHEAFYQVDRTGQKSLGPSPSGLTGTTSENSGIMVDKSLDLRIEIADIAGLGRCADLSLPPGAGFCIDMPYGQRYLVAETWEAVDCWVDAIRLVYTIYVRGHSDVLAGIIAG